MADDWRKGLIFLSEWQPTHVLMGNHDQRLYDLAEDPLQRVNLWSDPERRSIRDDLGTALEDALPERSQPVLMAESPV